MDKPVKLFDGAGSFVLVKPTGAKYRRLKHWHGGLEKTLALGVYPEVSLKRARERRDEARHAAESADRSEFTSQGQQTGEQGC